MSVAEAVRPPLPRHLQVEVTGACNLACRMCLVRYRPKLGRTQGAMTLETFKELLDELPTLEKLTLQGLGEPLLAPDFFEMVEYATARGIRVGFNTNGTLLTRARSERLIRAGVDWLHVSVDGATAETYEGVRDGSNFERVRRNILDLVDARRALGSEKPELEIVFVAMRRNVRELPDLVRLVASWGVEKLWVQNLSHSFSDTDPAGSYLEIRDFAAEEALWAEGDGAEEIFAEAERLAGELGLRLRLPRLAEPPPRPRRPGAPGCHWPFEEAYVTHDGNVQPCCMVMGSDRVSLGRLGEARFAEIWHDERYREFRQALIEGPPPEVCEGCSLYKRVF